MVMKRSSFCLSTIHPTNAERQSTVPKCRFIHGEMRDLKEVVADLTLENRVLKKSVIADGDDDI